MSWDYHAISNQLEKAKLDTERTENKRYSNTPVKLTPAIPHTTQPGIDDLPGLGE